MDTFLDLLLLGLCQFAGGPGPPENNLVRFGLPAMLWGMLLVVAWSRQRTRELPRERLLVWGFGLGFARELFMFVQVAERVLGRYQHIEGELHQPIEHALAMAAIVVVAGAFLRYILDDKLLPRRYLQAGLGVTIAGFALTAWTWPRYLAAHPGVNFHETWEAWLFHLPLSILIAVAIFFLARQRGWLPKVVIVALTFFFLGEVLMLSNYATDRAYDYIVCPIGNTFHILAVPLLGYVYLREQSIEKRRAERALAAYRDQLEDLVRERTEELTTANTRLAAQNAVAATLSRSLDLDSVLNAALDTVLKVLNMQAGVIFLLNPKEQGLVPQIQRGQVALDGAEPERGAWRWISTEAVTQMRSVVFPAVGAPDEVPSTCPPAPEFQTLVSTPLVAKGRAVGALTLGARHAGAIQQAGLELLTAIGQQVGMAVEQARLHKQLEWAAALEERQRIAADMHDGLGQTLSLLGLRVDRAAELVDERVNGAAVQELRRVREVIGQASKEVRRSIASLREDPQPRRSLQSQLSEWVGQFPSKDGPHIDLVIRLQEPLFVPASYTEQALPIVQEAILNAQRHAHAGYILVTLDGEDSDISLTVRDDGQGFDPSASHRDGEGHFGLSIMRARAARIGARLQIDSAPGRGARVCLTWSPDADRAKVHEETSIELSAAPALSLQGVEP
jgi:signal transduction histidine kinase